MLNVSGSTSTKTGFALTLTIGKTVVDHVTAGVITSSLILICFLPNSGLLSIESANKLAEEPEFTITAYFTPIYFANNFSKD